MDETPRLQTGPEKFGRVAGRHCWRPALQEPDLKVSFHPARALNNASIKTKTQPYANANKTYSILIGGRVTRRWKDPSDAWEAAPMVCTVVICFASFLGSSNGLEFV
jgi:hypothetical protein